MERTSRRERIAACQDLAGGGSKRRGLSALWRTTILDSPFRAQFISEAPLEIAQRENHFRTVGLRFLAGDGIMGLLTVEGFVSV